MAASEDGDGKTATDAALGATIDLGGKAPDDVPRWLGDRYRVLEVLGRGGMGAVYLARDEALVCEVALKMVAPERASDAQGLARLRDEVLLAQKVTHPNVCRTYDLEEIDGNWLIKMEYVAGETLARRLARERLSVDEAVSIAEKVCAGLAAAHGQGVVHRDLKPHNIMIERATGRVVLMDFGIARTSARAGQTADEGVSGTPEYMAPEQVRGREVDGRADLYALGCVLYEMLAGERVFGGATGMAAAMAHVEEPAPALPAAVPERLRRLVARLLEKNPARRPADAAEVAAALAAPPRRRRWWLGAAAVAVLPAAAAVFVWVRSPRQWHAEIRELPYYDESADGPKFSPDGKRIAYASDREEPNRFRIYVESIEGGESRAVTPRGMNVGNAKWTSDGAALLFTEWPRGRAFRLALPGGTPEAIAADVHDLDDCHGRLLLLYWDSPLCDGCQRLALRETDGQEREIRRFGTGEALGYLRCDRAGRQALYFLADHAGRVTGFHTDLWVVPLDGGAARRVTSGRPVEAGTFTADGRSVVIALRQAGTSHLWDTPTDGSAEPRQLTLGVGDDGVPDVAPDGRTLIFNVDTALVQLFAYPTKGGPRQKLTAKVQDLAHPRPTPDGRAIVAASLAPDGRGQIVRIPVDGGEPLALADGATPDLTPRGDEVVFAEVGGGRVRAVPVAGGPSRAIAEAPGRVTRLGVGADEKVHLAIAKPDGFEAWAAPLAGGPATREAAAPWFMIWPAPVGGWRAALAPSLVCTLRIRFLPPGDSLDDTSAHEVEASSYGSWARDGRSYLYVGCDGRAHRFWVETGEDRELAAVQPHAGVAVSPDGETLYTTEAVRHTRRVLITNFADRR